jgi:hypothetical protein
MDGNSLTPRNLNPIVPNKMMRMDITMAKTGRLTLSE